MSGAFAEWAETDAHSPDDGFRTYMHSVAEARYVVRKVVRIVAEQAKRAGLDPLEHEALLQIYGADEAARLSVNRIAEHLDVAPALASRVIKALDTKRLVRREQDADDKRVTLVVPTDVGIAMLRSIDQEVHVHIDYFRKQLENDDRLSLMAIFAFWVGLDSDSRIGGAIRSSLAARADDAMAKPPKRSKKGSNPTPVALR